ncbi:MAG: N-acetylglucosamine-1-phosphate uridyltransferase [Candidatus Muproteobacteria bacterium RIFCSPHIGHO2_02_FULL_60_13]|nr:MAG: N-acetylglucosamine-1-phosphate uridyltransferase [Candidatus Muproteobacteria bacterium RIFCSPHIGHO2_02_FULL_60_13]
MPGPDYDVVVIGGGIHGVGVAQAAVAAGYSALLLERQALGSGTSSRSSKLIHGGLRYLESAHLGLVRESLREREILLRVAPTLVRRVPFYIPVYSSPRRPPWMIRAGLSLYAVLGGLSRDTRFESVPRARWESLDGLDTRGLRAVFRYEDARTDDILLTQAVMRSAQTLGAELRCPANFLSAIRSTNGFKVHYLEGNGEKACHAKTLVNAAGPWANAVLDRITPRPPRLTVDLVQGTHILVEGEIRHGVYYVEAPSDGRAVFVMPWQGHTLVGTTETPYDGDPGAVRARPEEIAYLRETLQHYFPHSRGRLLDSFAGLRVLPQGPGSMFHRSRETVLHPDNADRVRLVTVYGGKLTGYRATAAKVMRLLKKSLPSKPVVADTSRLTLSP